MTKGVYLLHFNVPVKYDKASQYGDEQHYVGLSENIETRVYQHYSSDGAEMTKAAMTQGNPPVLAAILPGDASPAKERYVQKNVKEFCIICRMSEKEEPKPEVKQEAKPTKRTLKTMALAQEKPPIERVEWASPFTLRFKNNCDRCGTYMPANSEGAKVSGATVCLKCVRPEERGTRLAHLNNG